MPRIGTPNVTMMSKTSFGPHDPTFAGRSALRSTNISTRVAASKSIEKTPTTQASRFAVQVLIATIVTLRRAGREEVPGQAEYSRTSGGYDQRNDEARRPPRPGRGPVRRERAAPPALRRAAAAAP